MQRIKCKKSVFCILFLFSFFLGTICGVLLFRYLAGDHGGWIKAYCEALVHAQPPGAWSLLLSWCRPLLLAYLAGLVPWGGRTVPFLIAARGLVTAYCAAAFYACGQPMWWIVARGLALLPVFYLICRWAYTAFPSSLGE